MFIHISNRCKRRYVHYGNNHSLRNDKEYLQCVDEDHRKDGQSPPSMLPMGISQVPFKYMHLAWLGIMKKLLSAWIHGYIDTWKIFTLIKIISKIYLYYI